MGNNWGDPCIDHLFSNEQKEGRLVMVLLLPALGGRRLVHISQLNEAPPHGVGNICSKICLCLCIHSHRPCLLAFGIGSGDRKRIEPRFPSSAKHRAIESTTTPSFDFLLTVLHHIVYIGLLNTHHR